MKLKRIKHTGVWFWAVINPQGVRLGLFQSMSAARWYADQCESSGGLA